MRALYRIRGRLVDRWLLAEPRPAKPLSLRLIDALLDALDLPLVWRMERAHKRRTGGR